VPQGSTGEGQANSTMLLEQLMTGGSLSILTCTWKAHWAMTTPPAETMQLMG
jgi:hypothetical protein